jgi:amino acid transporter
MFRAQNPQNKTINSIGLFSAMTMSLSGMMGSGLFTVLGFANLTAGTNFPTPFLLAGIAIFFTVYSCARMSATFSMSGGPAGYIVAAYGDGFIAGWMNLFFYIGFLISTALYAAGFSEFIAVLTGNFFTGLELKLIGAALVIFLALLNLLGASVVGLAGSVAIGLVFLSLIGFSGVGITHIQISNANFFGGSLEGIAIATGMLYVNYQGFAVVTSAAGSMAEPKKTIPQAMLIATPLIIFLYVLVGWVAIQVIPHEVLQANPGNAIGAAANILVGKTGFMVIGIAALLACAAGVNATIFTATKVLGIVIHEHANLVWLSKTMEQSQVRPLLLSSAIVISLVVGFPLEMVGKMASMAFLLLFGVITIGHLRIRQQTGTSAVILWCGVLINLSLFTFLFIDGITTEPSGVIVLVLALLGTFLFQLLYHFMPVKKN